MTPRWETGKKRAQRIDMQYFTRGHPLRTWRLRLTAGAVVLAVALAAWGLVDRRVHSMGPVTSSHASFGQSCEFCHASRKAAFREHVTDKACFGCHDGPVHSGVQTFTPSCGSCHFEHTGVSLTRLRDVQCTQCHADLEVKALTPRIEREVKRFDGGHPEFAVLRQGARDAGTLRFNHAVHLDPGKLVVRGSPQLVCNDCHRPPSLDEPWLHGDEKYREIDTSLLAPRAADVKGSGGSGAHMEPVRFDRSCSSCHALEFAAGPLAGLVPHVKTEAVHDFLTAQFTEYAAANPDQVLSALDGGGAGSGGDAGEAAGEASRTRLPGGRPPVSAASPAARTKEEWIAIRVAEAEATLWKITCRACHAIQSGEPLPQVLPVASPRWFPRARFDHQPHTMLACESCHDASASQSASDVLVPGVRSCQQCHRPRGVDDGCTECHDYHDWTQAQRVKGKYRIEQLRGGRAAADGLAAGQLTSRRDGS